jgi:hypothetical protein
MTHVRWRFVLPAIQLVVAVAAHVYGPHEYRVQARHDRATSNIIYYFQHYPAPTERVSLGVNFPALTLSFPFREASGTIYEHNSPYTNVRVSYSDVTFFAAIVLFWQIVGGVLERRCFSRVCPRWAQVAGVILGVGFTILVAAHALRLVAEKWQPEREMGAFGLAWAALLISLFAWGGARRLGASRAKGRVVLACSLLATSAGFLLWVGGPWGITQALGEYLRPSAVLFRPISPGCSPLDAAPAGILRAIEFRRQRLGLTLQATVICHSQLPVVPMAHRTAKSLYDFEPDRVWQYAGGDHAVSQFRRHFVVAAISDDGRVVVEAALVQSRWDFLRLNWHRLRREWAWPYGREP